MTIIYKRVEANYLSLVNRSYQSNIFSLVDLINVMLQLLAIYSKYSFITWILDLDSTVGKDLFHHKWASPPRSQLTQVEMQIGVIKMHPLIRLKILSKDLLVMSYFHFCLIDLGIVISVIPQFLNFKKLEFALNTCNTEIKVMGLDGLICLMFELDR